MAPTTRASKGPNFVHIAIHKTPDKKIEKVTTKLLSYLPRTKQKYVKKLVNSLQIAAAAGETREELEVGLDVMASLMSEIKKAKKNKARLDAYSEIGDLVYDYLTPYKDCIAADWGGASWGIIGEGGGEMAGRQTYKHPRACTY
jgi:hypothetical protein